MSSNEQALELISKCQPEIATVQIYVGDTKNLAKRTTTASTTPTLLLNTKPSSRAIKPTMTRKAAYGAGSRTRCSTRRPLTICESRIRRAGVWQ